MRAFVWSESVPRLWFCFVGLRRQWHRTRKFFSVHNIIYVLILCNSRTLVQRRVHLVNYQQMKDFQVVLWLQEVSFQWVGQLRWLNEYKNCLLCFRIHHFDHRHQHIHRHSNLHILSPARQLTIKWCRINLSWDLGLEDMLEVQEGLVVWECRREWETSLMGRQDSLSCQTTWIPHGKVSVNFFLPPVVLKVGVKHKTLESV